MAYVPTDAPPDEPARLVDDFTPVAHRRRRAPPVPRVRRADRHARRCSRPSRSSARSTAAIGVFGIGCYTAFSNNLDIEVLQALHGRAPSLATGVKRAKPDTSSFTIQGDGDMVNEGLQEVCTPRRGARRITCFMLEQRRVRRDRRPHDRHHRARPAHQEHARRPRRRAARLPDPAQQPASPSSTARPTSAGGAVNNAGNVARTKKMIAARASRPRWPGEGFSFVEILTMCPTGWFIETHEAPELPRPTRWRRPTPSAW